VFDGHTTEDTTEQEQTGLGRRLDVDSGHQGQLLNDDLNVFWISIESSTNDRATQIVPQV
jgi:hypothetical protein